MKKLASTIAFTATIALTALTAAAPADAASRHHHRAKSYHGRAAGPGYYEGLYEYKVDRNDRASSPYSDF
jgi:hypothetical protein